MKASGNLATPPGATIGPDALSYDWRVADQYPEDARRIVEANRPALQWVRQARDLPEADWHVRFTSPLINVLLPNLAPQRQLAKFVRTAAYVKHSQGDDAEAVELLRDVLAFADHTRATERTTLITHLVAVAIDAVGVAVIERIAPHLRIAGEATPPVADSRPASREQVRALIHELLSEQGARQGLQAAWMTERASAVDAGELCLRGGWANVMGAGNPALLAPKAARPLIEMDVARMLDAHARMIEAVRAPTWPAARRLLPPDDWSSQNELVRLSRPVSEVLMYSSARAVVLHYRSIAQRRMAAAALAVRLYEVDHGRRPATLDELVPDYLDAVPLDLFADDGRAIRYRPDADPPILYVRGVDADHGGKIAYRSSGTVDFDGGDIPFFLNGDAPLGRYTPPTTLPASGQAVIDYSQHDGEEGDADGGEEEPGPR
jgi:hypothetical protein